MLYKEITEYKFIFSNILSSSKQQAFYFQSFWKSRHFFSWVWMCLLLDMGFLYLLRDSGEMNIGERNIYLIFEKLEFWKNGYFCLILWSRFGFWKVGLDNHFGRNGTILQWTSPILNILNNVRGSHRFERTVLHLHFPYCAYSCTFSILPYQTAASCY